MGLAGFTSTQASTLQTPAAVSTTALILTATSTPVPWLPPDVQKYWDYFVNLIAAYGPGTLALAALVMVLIWLGGRFLNVVKIPVEEKFEEVLEGDRQFQQTTRDYLEKVIQDCSRFKFRGLDTRARGVEPPELNQTFVCLRMTPEADRPKTSPKTGRQYEILGEGIETAQRQTEPLDLADSIRMAPRLAIVGAAGSGKSTLLQWAGLALASAYLEKDDLKEDQKDFVHACGEKPILPLLFPLRAFNRFCEEKKRSRKAAALLDFFDEYTAEKHPSLNLPAGFFRRHLSESDCLVMLDGVDEVDVDDREHVREAIDELVREYQEKNPRHRYLITSRTAAYFGSAEASGFRKCEVQNLAPDQRDQLIRGWCKAVYPSADEAGRQARDLIQRLNNSEEQVQALAVTPLMVTIFALVHYDRKDLPRQRAELYEHAVRILLTEPYKDTEEASELRKGWETRRNKLAFIAFEMHAANANDLLEEDLIDMIWDGFGSAEDEKKAREAAKSFVQQVTDRGGLLEEDNRRYGFYTHRTFREFLAGRYLAEEKTAQEQKEFLLERLGDDQWKEPVQLAVGFLGAGVRRANEMVRLIAGLGATDQQKAQALALAGWAFSDLSAETRQEKLSLETYQKLSAEMLAFLQANPPRAAQKLRAELGLALGAIGDPRLRIEAFESDARAILPELVSIPAGTFQMGTSEADEQKLKAQNVTVWGVEKPAHLVRLSGDYAIARYPVTNAEFAAFYQAGGYDLQKWGNAWSPEGRRWREGTWTSELRVYPEDVRKDVQEWLEGRPIEKRDRPFFWDDPRWNGPNQPVVGVCWFEAEAYANWLGLVTGRPFRLPSEAEWERAARFVPAGQQKSGETRLWPWGDAWDESRCNNREPKDALGCTSAVGIYPHGDSALGCADLVGNVWEWCRDYYDEGEYARRKRTGEPALDPTGPAEGMARVVRGGSWYDDRDYARCAFRHWYVPVGFSSDLGFRLLLPPSGS